MLIRFVSGLLAFVAAFACLRAQPAADPRLDIVVQRAAADTVERFRTRGLQPEQLAITLVDLRDPAAPRRGSVRGDVLIYPASVIKLFYLAATHRWMEDGRIADTAEVRRAMRDMIVDSSNDATHYLIDLLTGTTSGPELPDPEIKVWFEKRNAVTSYFASLGYTGVLAHKKPWGDGPYGREWQAIRLFEPKRNMLTTDDTARLFTEIVAGKCVSVARSAEMMALLSRDPAAKSADPDDQAKFTGPALPPGSRLWSKAGWTSQTRHDAACIELPGGARFILVVFTTGHAGEREIIRTAARSVIAGMTDAAKK
ncbi:MAG: serine hydrolase [Opitutaceae bacterium]|nr:serine hydrolase [Opitutaceae bacterium]